MAFRATRFFGDSLKWLVTIALIVVISQYGRYGVNWRSRTSVLALLIAIAVLAACISFWKPWKRKS